MAAYSIPSCPRFPNEIFDRIIDFAHHDRKTLSICGLVCRSWLPASRHHLFSDFVLKKRSQERKGIQATEAIVVSPRQTFLKAIKSIILSEVDVTHECVVNTIHTLGSHAQCLPRMLIITSCDFWAQRRTLQPRHKSPREHHHRMTRMVVAIVAGFRSIVDLSLIHISFKVPPELSRLLQSFPVLQKLSIVSLDLVPTAQSDTQAAAVPPTPLCLPSLKQLSLTGSFPSSDRWWLDIMSTAITSLTSLDIMRMNLSQTPDSIAALLRGSYMSLRSLRVVDAQCVIRDLSPYVHLHHIGITIDLHDFDGATSLLPTCALQPDGQPITLHVNFDIDMDGQRPSHMLSLPLTTRMQTELGNLNILDKMLATDHRLPKRFQVTMDPDEAFWIRRFALQPAAFFPLCKGQGLIPNAEV